MAADEEADELVAAARDDSALEGLVRRREQGEPLAWLTGRQEFCGRAVLVDRGVYVPRRQSEALARRAAALLREHPGRAADLCTGAGAIAAHLAAEVPAATVVAVDVDVASVACARRNGVRAVLGDLGRPLRSVAFDVVTAVAPYVPTGALRLLPADVQRYEPRGALDGGGDGLDVVRRVVVDAARLLREGGWLVTEVGSDQDARLAPALAAAGFAPAEPLLDDEGDLRGLACRLETARVAR